MINLYWRWYWLIKADLPTPGMFLVASAAGGLFGLVSACVQAL